MTAVGIIGAGRLGRAMARVALRAGRTVTLANSRGPESLTDVVAELGATAGTVAEASAAGIVVIAVPGTDWADDDLNGRTSSELVAERVGGACVVKAANTLGADDLGSDPQQAGGRRVLFLSGDDAKADVVALFEEAGLAPLDLGGLATGGAMQQIHHPLAGLNLIRL
jgi:predicted dinucleotide-binding enzyme